jgi:CheY-like chemotaxis protein
MHGGRVAAYSAGPGLGSVFTVWLPARVAPAQPAAAEEKSSHSPATGMRVLVVDDDYHVANSTAVVLAMDGYEVRVVSTGQATLEMVPGFHPQVVLLDIGLKGMDGFETAQRLRQLPEGRDLCLVAVTGYGDEKTRARAMASGYDHFLVKPVTYKTLSALLTKIAGSPGLAEQNKPGGATG